MVSGWSEMNLNAIATGIEQRYKFHNPSSPSNALSGSGTVSDKQTHPRPQARIWTSTSSPTLKAVLLFLLNQGEAGELIMNEA